MAVVLEEVLSKIVKPFPPSPETDRFRIKTLRPPKSSKSIRYFQLNWMRDPTTQKVNILFNTAKELAAEVAILKHCNNGLRNAIVL